MRKYAIFFGRFLASVCMMVWMLSSGGYVYLSAPLVSILLYDTLVLLRKEVMIILELTKGEIFELIVSALGGFLLLCKWMKSTNMRKVRNTLKTALDGLSIAVVWGFYEAIFL